MTLWLVRAGKGGYMVDFALENDVAVIEFDELGDLSDVESRDQVLERLQQEHPDKKANTLINWGGQVWSFVRRIEEGDFVALPISDRSSIALGRVTGPYRHVPHNPSGAQHVHPVEWQVELPRDRFDQDLLYSFGAFMTVCRVRRNNAEERVRALLENKPAPTDSRSSTISAEDAEADVEEVTAPRDLEQFALDQIRSHIGRHFKGHGLAHLTAKVLEVQGFQTRTSPKGPDGGVDILAGQGPMGFDSPRLCVQVKSSDSPADVRVLRELQGVMKNFGADQGLIVSWGGFKKSVLTEAAQLFFEIRLWNADHLVQMIQAHYEQLPDSLQAELPLKRIWTLVPEEV